MKTQLLPHQSTLPFISDGGQETTLVYHEGMDLPCFAAFPLLKTSEGRDWFRQYYNRYLAIARQAGVGFILESPTWRASPDWADKLGYSRAELQHANREAIGLMHEIREANESPNTPILVSGCVGPRGDGYVIRDAMTAGESSEYHGPQLRIYRDAGADLVTGMTINYLEEALGIANAAAELRIPCVISFTTETDGHLPDGHSLREAIESVDNLALTAPAYYMINCAHPTHFADQLTSGEDWLKRIVGLRANASCKSHAELDASTELDPGDPVALGVQYRELRELLPNLNVLGGCCGTDHRHIESICDHCLAVPAS